MWVLGILARIGKFARPSRLFQKTPFGGNKHNDHVKVTDPKYAIVNSQ